jgi:hypothetical protein
MTILLAYKYYADVDDPYGAFIGLPDTQTIQIKYATIYRKSDVLYQVWD